MKYHSNNKRGDYRYDSIPNRSFIYKPRDKRHHYHREDEEINEPAIIEIYGVHAISDTEQRVYERDQIIL
jgi:hypothetical protein